MKIIGYGKENDVPYWLASNSWGRNWGDRGICRLFLLAKTCFKHFFFQGFFKIHRGSNGVEFEDQIIAAIPSHSLVGIFRNQNEI